ncbi:glycosyltransferase family 4 protein [Candidatus Undinarchaeota archaeon]
MKILVIGKLSGGIGTHVSFLKKYSKNDIRTFTYGSDGDYSAPIINFPVLRALTFLLIGFPYGLYCIKKEKPDIIHSHFILPAGLLGFILAKLTGRKFYLTVHGSDIKKANILKPLKKWICRNANVIAVSKYLSKELKEWNVKAKVIPNGVDLYEIKKAKKIKIRKPAALFVGSLVPEKVDFLPEIISPNQNFYIIGDGKLSKSLDGIKLGQLPQSKVYQYMKSADCLISTSKWEGFGLTILEAMACGLPVIVRPNTASKELANGRGLFADSPQEFTSQIEKLLKDSKLKNQFIKRGREYARKFDWRETARLTDNFYKL